MKHSLPTWGSFPVLFFLISYLLIYLNYFLLCLSTHGISSYSSIWTLKTHFEEIGSLTSMSWSRLWIHHSAIVSLFRIWKLWDQNQRASPFQECSFSLYKDASWKTDEEPNYPQEARNHHENRILNSSFAKQRDAESQSFRLLLMHLELYSLWNSASKADT